MHGGNRVLPGSPPLFSIVGGGVVQAGPVAVSIQAGGEVAAIDSGEPRLRGRRYSLPAIELMSLALPSSPGGVDPMELYARHGLLRRFAPALEAEYRVFQEAALRKRVPWALGAAACVLGVYAVLDLFLIPRQILSDVLVVRLGLMLLPPLAVLSLVRLPRWRNHVQLLAGLACLSAGLGAVTLITRTRVLGMPVDYEGILLVLMYVYGCGAMQFGTAILCGTTICIAYPLAEAWAGLPRDELLMRTIFICTTNVIGIVTAWILDQEGRGNFVVTRQLRGLAHLDYLTGLPNRRAFAERVEALWEQAGARQRPMAIALVDVDWFKAYNDHYGHPAGDQVLRAVGQVLARHARGPQDLVARYGGEEFVCVWYEASLAQVQEILRAVHADIAALDIAHAGSEAPHGRLTLSIGLHHLVPRPGQAMHEALQQADQALYEAKAGGRNTTVLVRA